MSTSPDRGTHSDSRIEALRRRAERVLEAESHAERQEIQRDVASLLEDLRVHQIELELQNEELRATQTDLETSRERYRELFDNAPTGYVLFSRDGLVEDINLTGVDQLRAERRRIVGKPFLLFLEPSYRDLFSHHLRLTLEMQEEQMVEVILKPKQGQTFWARLQSVPFPGGDGEMQHSVRTAIINISEQKKLEQELIAAREEAMQTTQVQRAFLSSMSHEIRTPLTSVIGFSDVLDDLAQDDQQKRIARLIKGSGRRLLSTLNSVLSYARLQEEEDDMELQPMNVAEIVHESVQLLQPLAEAQGVALIYEADDTTGYAPVHEEHLDRILDNLIGNGLKYTDDGTVTVRVRTTDAEVEVDVEDTGVGIDDNMQAMIFEPFFQAGSGLEETRDGIGLGLSITQKLVTSMQGTIRVESERGQGTCFTLAFPRVAKPPPARPDNGTASSLENALPGDEPAWRVLLVDDQEDIHELVSLFLRGVATVTGVRTGADAVEALKTHAFDAVLADIRLEERETGIELFHRIRSLAVSHDIPVIAFTAYALPGDRERFERAGFDAYLGKPFTKGDLLTTLHDVV